MPHHIIHPSAGTSYSLLGVCFNSQRSQAAGTWAPWGLGRHIPKASLEMPFLIMWAVIFIRMDSPSFHPMWGGLLSPTIEFCCSKPGVEWGSCPSAGPQVVTAAAWAQQANGLLTWSPAPSACQGLGSHHSHCWHLFSEVCVNYSMLRIIVFCRNVCSEKESTVWAVEGFTVQPEQNTLSPKLSL